MSVRMEQLCCYRTYFHEILYLSIFSEICYENSVFIKIGQEKLVLYRKATRNF